MFGVSAADDPHCNGWMLDVRKRWRFYEDGYAKFGWQTIGGKHYYFDENAATFIEKSDMYDFLRHRYNFLLMFQ